MLKAGQNRLRDIMGRWSKSAIDATFRSWNANKVAHKLELAEKAVSKADAARIKAEQGRFNKKITAVKMWLSVQALTQLHVCYFTFQTF